jgi:polar amino acid transport system substrate-binding protein
MKVLTQKLKNGEMEIQEVSFPNLSDNYVLVQNYYSVISAGTEGKTVNDARANYLEKALARKDEVKEVYKLAKEIGVFDTYKIVKNRLESPSVLGYSTSGKVIGVGDEVKNIRIGDYVACAGGSHAFHAEVSAVPENLVVKVSNDIDMLEASYTTIGSIALQGVRQSDLKLGENCLVIGLGLIGQITMQILEAAGVNVIGVDIDKEKVEIAKKIGFENCFERQNSDITNHIEQLTNGFGVDAVIITAATDSNDPVNFAGQAARKKAKVIVVGAVPTGFKRENYYKKELELKMACSYGPGRYDNNYEEKSIDYPYEYVRWTENRNMQAFVELIKKGDLRLDYLNTHCYEFENIESAYDLITEDSENYLGIAIKYKRDKELDKNVEFSHSIPKSQDKINIGIIGAGSFAQKFVLPNLRDNSNLISVLTSKGQNARYVAQKFGIKKCVNDAKSIFQDPEIDTVFILTRHDLHARHVVDALNNDKNVYVEKPLCLNSNELEQIKNAYESSKRHLMVGFNRRFAPFAKKIKNKMSENLPIAINCRVNVGDKDKDHWTYDPDIGGGLIIGEACHFIDLCNFIVGSKPKSVYTSYVPNKINLIDTVNISLSFGNNSIANISFFANGNTDLDKERIEVFSGGKSYIITDFKRLDIYGSEQKTLKSKINKGRKSEINAFIDAIKNKKTTPINFEDVYYSTKSTFNAIDSIKTNEKVEII